MIRRLVVLAFVIVTVSALMVPAVTIHANPASFVFDAVVESACTPGTHPIFDFHFDVGADETVMHVWILTNKRTGKSSAPMISGPFIQTAGFDYFSNIPGPAVPQGTLPGDTLVQRVEVYLVDGAQFAPARQQGELVDVAEISWTCGGKTAAGVVPGCTLPLPEGSVVGQFVDNATVSWQPGTETSPAVTIEAGKTAWVLGVDESLAYYKIAWACQYLWVPVGTMGPNPDAVWNSTALPLTVVE